jgi:RHS repeat-associated protein
MRPIRPTLDPSDLRAGYPEFIELFIGFRIRRDSRIHHRLSILTGNCCNNSSVLTKHVHYVYDVFDHLLATQVDTTGSGSYNQIEHYVLDVSPDIPAAGVPGTALAQPLLQFDGSGNLTTRYLEAHDRIFAQGAVVSPTTGDTVNWDVVDNLGSVREVLDNTGIMHDKIDYNAFGQVAYESNAAIHHFAGYTGGHIDIDTGFVEDYHRWYDPATGAWLSADPKGFIARDANLDRYVGNAPADKTDATGLDPSATIAALQAQLQTAYSDLWHGQDSFADASRDYSRHRAKLQNRLNTASRTFHVGIDVEVTNHEDGIDAHVYITGPLQLIQAIVNNITLQSQVAKIKEYAIDVTIDSYSMQLAEARISNAMNRIADIHAHIDELLTNPNSY